MESGKDRSLLLCRVNSCRACRFPMDFGKDWRWLLDRYNFFVSNETSSIPIVILICDRYEILYFISVKKLILDMD